MDFKVAFSTLGFAVCSHGTQSLCIPNGSQFILLYAVFVWRLNSQEARNGPMVDVSKIMYMTCFGGCTSMVNSELLVILN